MKELGNDYKILQPTEELETIKNKIKILHLPCGNVWDVRPRNILYNKNKCPKCVNIGLSSGEKKIKDYLDKKNIPYQYGYVSDLLGVSKTKHLHFDFKIEVNGKFGYIEFDGRYHYLDDLNNKKYIRQKQNDKIKDDFCLNNKIDLLRIPFFEKEKTKILINDLVQRLSKA